MSTCQFTKVENQTQIEQTAQLAREIWGPHYEPIIGSNQVEFMLERFQSTTAISQQINSENYQYYLIETDSTPIGYFAILPQEADLYLSKFYVKKEYRGKGFGRSCFDFIEEYAKNHSFSSISLNVNKHNLDTIAVYRKLGFEIIEAVVIDIGNGFFMDDYRMQKHL